MGGILRSMEEVKKPVSKVRSASYPNASLQEAVDMTLKIKNALGNASFSRDSGAKALGYGGVNGASAAKIAALVHFGLLSRSGNVYRVTSIADRIALPISDDDKNLAIIEAAKSPKLYSTLAAKFNNSSLPAMLNNILVHDHGINEKVSKKVVSDFVSSMEFAGLLKNGIIVNRDEKSSEVKVDNIVGNLTQPPKQNNLYETPSLPSGIKILFPEKLKAYFALGDFSGEIKALEKKAQDLLKSSSNEEENS